MILVLKGQANYYERNMMIETPESELPESELSLGGLKPEVLRVLMLILF